MAAQDVLALFEQLLAVMPLEPSRLRKGNEAVPGGGPATVVLLTCSIISSRNLHGALLHNVALLETAAVDDPESPISPLPPKPVAVNLMGEAA